MRYPNLRYGNPTELAYYAMGVPLDVLAKRLRRDERTVRDWLSCRTRVPWWVPEILRLKQLEADLRHRQMGFGALAPRLGIVGADVVTLPTPDARKPRLPVDLGVEVINGVPDRKDDHDLFDVDLHGLAVMFQ